MLKIVVGEMSGCEFEPVSILPMTAEGKSEAITVGLAILRTLKLIDSIDNGPPA